jgi:hypothetical protein
MFEGIPYLAGILIKNKNINQKLEPEKHALFVHKESKKPELKKNNF